MQQRSHRPGTSHTSHALWRSRRTHSDSWKLVQLFANVGRTCLSATSLQAEMLSVLFPSNDAERDPCSSLCCSLAVLLNEERLPAYSAVLLAATKSGPE